MTDGLHSLSVCNETFVSVTSHYPYRPYELLTVEVSNYADARSRKMYVLSISLRVSIHPNLSLVSTCSGKLSGPRHLHLGAISCVQTYVFSFILKTLQ